MEPSPSSPSAGKRIRFFLPVLGAGALLIVAIAARSNLNGDSTEKRSRRSIKSSDPTLSSRYSIAEIDDARRLMETATRLYEEGQQKWSERALEPGNPFLAFRKWEEALHYLQVLDARPPYWTDINEKRRMAQEYVEERFNRLMFERARAKKRKDRSALRKIYPAIMALYPEEDHPRRIRAFEELNKLRVTK